MVDFLYAWYLLEGSIKITCWYKERDKQRALYIVKVPLKPKTVCLCKICCRLEGWCVTHITVVVLMEVRDGKLYLYIPQLFHRNTLDP